MHDSLKRDNNKENDERKNVKNEKELKDLLWDVAAYFKLSFLKNGSQ